MARKHLKAGALTAPLPPVIVTVGDMEKANMITVAWTGILSTVPPRTYISVRPSRHSHALLSAGGEFVINLPRSTMAREVDYIGIYTGAKVDKFEKTGLTMVPSEHVAPPTVAECPIALECRVFEVRSMGTHDVFLADILGVSCDDAILDGEGKMHFERADLLAYAHGEYFALGERLGSFGFSTKKKKSRAPEKKKAPRGQSAAGASGETAPNAEKYEKNEKPKAAKEGIRAAAAKWGEREHSAEEEPRRPFYLDAPRGKGKRRRGQK